jgi:hypothetical protein
MPLIPGTEEVVAIPEGLREVTIDLTVWEDGIQTWTPMCHLDIPSAALGFIPILTWSFTRLGYSLAQLRRLQIPDIDQAMNTGIVKVLMPLKSP